MTEFEHLKQVLAERRRNYSITVYTTGATILDYGPLTSRRQSTDPIEFHFDRAGNFIEHTGNWFKAVWLSRGTGIMWPGHYTEDLP